tara:strand:+ start:981 stop:2180 length:1200 start_codon:yes stop_codon:yes gene_type:complete
MSLNKPRPDYPIYPSTGYFRERAKAFKRPKGRKGRKPKGKRVGSFVPYQDPNFLIFKAQDEARKARELALAEAQQAQADREERISIARQQLQLAQGSAQLQAQQAIEADETRRQEALARRDEARAREAQADQLRLESDRREQRLLEDRKEIAGHLTRLYETSERRAGENIKIFTEAFKAITDRRPVDFRDIKLQEQTDLTADQRRDRRGRSESLDRAVSVGLESLAGTPKGRQRTPSPERKRQVEQVKQQLQPEPKPEPEPETKRNVPIETIEQTTTRGRDVKLPKRFEGGATEAELAEAGGIEGQTPAAQRYKQQPKPKTTARGGTGTEEVERQRPKLKAGEVIKAKQGGKAPVAKAVKKDKPIDTSVFGSSPAGKAFAEEVKKSEEALRKAKERGGN